MSKAEYSVLAFSVATKAIALRSVDSAELDRAGQVHQLGPVPDERGPDPAAGQPEPEARVAGQRDRGHPHHREGVRRLVAPPRPWRLGSDDERVVAASARSSATRSTQWATPLTSGGKDSVMIATLMVTPCDINRSRRRSRHDVQANLP